MRVGTWPGPGPISVFVERFCESLVKLGVSVRAVDRPRALLAGEIDILHIHWPEQVFWNANGRCHGMVRALGVLIALAWLRLHGVRLVWCVHNLEPHDANARYLMFWRFYSAVLSRLVHGCVTLSPSTLAIARDRFPVLAKKPGIFAWHPAYLISETAGKELEWRRSHGIGRSDTVIAFIGRVRRYKGLENLVARFGATDEASLRLVIAGAPLDKPLTAFLKEAARNDPRIVLDLRWLPEQKMQQTIAAADVVVLPFDRILHSGTIIYALSCGTAVLTPALPYAKDLQRRVGKGWLRTYEPPLSLADCLAFRKPPARRPDLEFLSIDKSGRKLKNFYTALRATAAKTSSPRISAANAR